MWSSSSAPTLLPAVATGTATTIDDKTNTSRRRGGQGDEGRELEDEEGQPQQQQQQGRRHRRSFSFPNSTNKKRQMQQQQQRAASSSSLATTTTTKRSSLGSFFLASLRRKNCSENNNPNNSSVAGSSRESHVGAGGRDKRNNKNVWQQQLQLQQNQLQQQLQQQQRLEEEAELQEKANSRIFLQKQQQHAMGQFLTHDCPTDVLPRIFAYTGPQMTCKLQQCNRFFSNVMNRQGTWRILCEELYKWKPGEPEPACWKEYYRLNPCVPVDFKSILSAVQTVGGRGGGAQQPMDDEEEKNKKHSTNNVDDDDDCSSSSNHNHDHAVVEIQNDLTVWLRPGRRYVLPRAVTITTLHRTNQVRIETQQLPPPESLIVQRQQEHHHAAAILVSSRNSNDKNYNNNINIDHHHHDHCRRRHNAPLFRVVRGTLVLRNVNLQHYSPGIDIWNGNAAIQVQPAAEAYLDLWSRWNSHMQTSSNGGGGGDGGPPPMASAILHQVQVQSSSGRGIVTVDGGQLHVQDSYIHDCAATGVYVGGSSSKATLMQTDILNNGTGNQYCSTGGGSIARGHSGVYVEQGTCVLDDCSVSRNSASGVCVIAESAFLDGFNLFHNNNNIHIDNNNNNMNAESLLTMRKTDVLANECNPLELLPQQQQGQFPNAAAAARREGETNNTNNVFHPQHENNISPGGTPRPRSSILRQA